MTAGQRQDQEPLQRHKVHHVVLFAVEPLARRDVQVLVPQTLDSPEKQVPAAPSDPPASVPLVCLGPLAPIRATEAAPEKGLLDALHSRILSLSFCLSHLVPSYPPANRATSDPFPFFFSSFFSSDQTTISQGSPRNLANAPRRTAEPLAKAATHTEIKAQSSPSLLRVRLTEVCSSHPAAASS